MKINWIEWLFVLGLGWPLSIVVNHHSTSGLDLARDYFPGDDAIGRMALGQQLAHDGRAHHATVTGHVNLRWSAHAWRRP